MHIDVYDVSRMTDYMSVVLERTQAIKNFSAISLLAGGVDKNRISDNATSISTFWITWHVYKRAINM